MTNLVRRIMRAVRNLVRPSRADAELDEELSFHVEMEAAQHVSAGVSPAEARRRALLAFGGMERHREAALGERSGRWPAEVWRDVRYAARSLRRTPLHAAVTLAALAVGIGATTAMFTVVDGVLLRPLAYPDPDRVFTLYEARPAGGIRSPSHPSFEDWRERVTAFEAVAFVRGDEFRVRDADGTLRLIAGYVSGDLFGAAGTPPLLGRAFDGGDDDSGVVVLSYGLWRDRFARDPAVLGTTLTTSDGSFTIIGVMPRGFRIPAYADVWTPIRSLPPDGLHALQRRDLHVDSEVWGRTRAGVTAEHARRDLARVVSGLAVEYPELAADWTTATLTPVRERELGDVAGQLRILGAAVALLLLIACVNVAGLQLARGTARVRELAVRSALGAGRGRLVRQLLVESALVSLIGGAAGLALAALAVGFVAGLPESVLPRATELGMDWRTLAFAAVVAMVVAIASGIVPALRASAAGLTPALRAGGGAGAAARTARLRSGLVVTQVALAVMLTVGSGLLLRSLQAVHRIDPGFEHDGVAVLRVFPPARYDDPDAARELYVALQEAVRAVPGVREVALTNHAPMAGGWMVTRMLAGEGPPAAGENVIIRTVSPEYFPVMGSRLAAGRLLTPADLAGAGGGVVLNDVAARTFFGGDDPVGRSVTFFQAAQGRPDFGEPVTATVVGVVGGERFFGPEANAPPALFVPFTWMVWPSITLLARTDAPPHSLVVALRRAVQRVDRDIPVAGPSPQAQWRAYDEFVAGAFEQRRLLTWALTAYAAAALALAIMGIFGVTAWLVARRSREIGIRVALGAVPASVTALVMRQALLLAGLGVVLGLPASFAVARLLSSQLHGVSATDPATLAAVGATFAAAAVLAAGVPLRRALRIAPTEALRTD